MKPSRCSPPAARQQRGFAVILLVLLVGLGLLGTMYAVFRNVQSAQEQTLALHARTPAEATAWYGTEAMRQYLDKVDQKTLTKWVGSSVSSANPVEFTLTGTGAVDSTGTSNLTARIIKVEKLSPSTTDYNYRATAHITGSAGTGRAKATAPVEVVFNFTIKPPPSPGGSTAVTDPILAGFRVRGTPTFPAQTAFKVLGDVDIANIAPDGLVDASFSATGNISVTDVALRMKRLHANGDVTLANAAQAEVVLSRGKVSVSGDGTHGDIRAHGDVSFKWARAKKVETRENLIVGVPWNGTASGSCFNETQNPNGIDATYIYQAYVEKNTTWHSCGGGLETLFGDGDLVQYHGAAVRPTMPNGQAAGDMANAQWLKVRGSITLRSAVKTGRFVALGDITWRPRTPGSNPSLGRLCSARNVKLEEYNSSLFATLVYAYGVVATAADPRNNGNVKSYGAVPPNDVLCNPTIMSWTPVDVPEVPVFNLTPPVIDANALRSDANFEFAHVGGDFHVKVRNMEGVQDDIYILGWRHSNPSDPSSDKLTDVLCPANKLGAVREPTASDQKQCSDTTAKRMCEAGSGGSCFHYESATDTFVVGAYPTAPRFYGNASTAARAIYFFPGNLEIGQKAFVATFIATGNILLGPNHHSWAPNAAGFNRTCQNQDLLTHENETVSSPSLAGFKSKTLCGPTALTGTKLGNVALIAGSFDANGNFTGGNITAQNGKTTIEGMVIAANKFTSRGHTTITGQIVGANQSGSPTPGVDIENTFSLIKPPAGQNDPGCLNNACKPSSGTNDARVLWARYR